MRMSLLTTGHNRKVANRWAVGRLRVITGVYFMKIVVSAQFFFLYCVNCFLFVLFLMKAGYTPVCIGNSNPPADFH